MISVGETLHRERLRRNLDLDQISQELKISSKFLEAIEEERFERLPGGVFVKSFVRQYARLLGLDEEELAGEVQRAMQPALTYAQPSSPPRQAPAEIHLPRVEQWKGVPDRGFSWSQSLPALAGVVVVMLVCSLVYNWWQRSRPAVSAHGENAVPSQTAEAPAAAVEPPATPAPGAEGTHTASGTPAAAGTQPPTGTQAAAGTPDAAGLPPATGTAGRPATEAPIRKAPEPAAPESAPASAVTAQPQATAAGGAPPSNPNAAVRVEVTAEEPVWVLARADGKFLFSGTLETSQTRIIEGNGTVVLRLGNAGGVSITLNGKPLGAPGPKGQVRTLQFTPGGFQTVAAPKPSLPPDDIL